MFSQIALLKFADEVPDNLETWFEILLFGLLLLWFSQRLLYNYHDTNDQILFVADAFMLAAMGYMASRASCPRPGLASIFTVFLVANTLMVLLKVLLVGRRAEPARSKGRRSN